MQEYEDLRKQKQEEYAAQRRRRIELRNSKSIPFRCNCVLHLCMI